MLGYDPAEFAESLRAIAEGEIDVPMITGEVGLDVVGAAFDGLADARRSTARSSSCLYATAKVPDMPIIARP